MAERYDHGIDLDYFKEHQDELVAQYNGKELLMHNTEVVGAFDTFGDAAAEGRQRFGRSNYSVQKCIPGRRAYTVTVGWGHFRKPQGVPVCN